VRLPRPLLPYVAAGLLIAAGSIALVFATVEPREAGNQTSGASGRAAPELSPTGRIAFWRQNPAGAFVLSAANFDGSSSRPLQTLSANASRPFGTRWTADGQGVGFVIDAGIALVGLDASRTVIALPENVRTAGFRVLDHRWSPSGRKVAATVFRSGDGRSDVYLGTTARGQLVRVDGLPNAFAADWISEDEVLVETSSGTLMAVREGGAARRVTSQVGASPILDGGRILFLSGAITASGDATGLFVNNPTVWSVAVDGTGARQEQRLSIAADLRLDGVWPDGRYLVKVFRDRNQWLAGDRLVTVSSLTLTRVIVSTDKRSAIGFGGGRIYRIDLTRGSSPSESAFVVLLDGVVGADAWVKRAAA
jgi:hypothetical protein